MALRRALTFWAVLWAIVAAGNRCKPSFPPGRHEFIDIWPGGNQGTRKYTLYVPQAASSGVALPVVLLTPGNENDPHDFLKFPDLLAKAESAPFLLVELMGDNNQFNVELHSWDNPSRPDDVAYVRAVLQKVQQQLCVDEDRVFCAGMSRGARFCVRLASELSDKIAALGIVSGLRYPRPNNATRPIPIVAFHGTADKIDPYEGGGFAYWGTATVPEELAKWSVFNDCQGRKSEDLQGHKGVHVEAYSHCSVGADVVLYTLKDAPHCWPGTPMLYGPQTHLLNVTHVLWEFLSQHPRKRPFPHAWSSRLFAETGSTMLPAAPHGWLPCLALPPLLGLLACFVPRRCRAEKSAARSLEAEKEVAPLL